MVEKDSRKDRKTEMARNSSKLHPRMARATIERKVQHVPDGNGDRGCTVKHLF